MIYKYQESPGAFIGNLNSFLLTLIVSKLLRNDQQILRRTCKYFHDTIKRRRFKLEENMPLEVLKTLQLSNKYIYLRKIIITGNLENVKWLINDGHEITGLLLNYAAEYGHLHIMKYLYSINCPIKTGTLVHQYLNITYCATNTGNLKLLDWLRSKGINPNIYALAGIAKHGDMNKFLYVKSIIKPKYPLPSDVFSHAAMSGNFEMLKYLHGKCNFDQYLFSNIAYQGKFEIMQWLLENGYKVDNDKDTFNSAALFGDLNIMKWLLENGFKISERTFSNAARTGKLENMIWLKENNCKMNMWAIEEAAELVNETGDLTNLKWLIINKCHWHLKYIHRILKKKYYREFVSWLIDTNLIKEELDDVTDSEFSDRPSDSDTDSDSLIFDLFED